MFGHEGWVDEERTVWDAQAERVRVDDGIPSRTGCCLKIFDSGKFPNRTFQAIKKQAQIIKKLGGIVATKPAAIVATIEPAQPCQ